MFSQPTLLNRLLLFKRIRLICCMHISEEWPRSYGRRKVRRFRKDPDQVERSRRFRSAFEMILRRRIEKLLEVEKLPEKC